MRFRIDIDWSVPIIVLLVFDRLCRHHLIGPVRGTMATGAFLRVVFVFTIGSYRNSFFAMDGVYAALSGNGIRSLKAKVERTIGEKFELRDCRRFCGQHYLDKGLTIEEVARLLGHYTTKTTETYYCRKNNAEVARRAKGVW